MSERTKLAVVALSYHFNKVIQKLYQENFLKSSYDSQEYIFVLFVVIANFKLLFTIELYIKWTALEINR